MKIKKRIALFLLMLAFCFTVGGQAFLSAFAVKVSAASSTPAVELSDPLDDLKEAMVCGEEFNTETFNFSASKPTQMIVFYEYGFSFYENQKDDLSFYVYIYNPKGLSFVDAEGAATITFKLGYDESELYTKYNMTLLCASAATNFEGLIYKYKVDLSSTQKENIWSSLNSSSRSYRVSELELAYTRNGETFKELIDVSTSFTYSGYMPGYGTNESNETTITYKSETFDTLSLDVKSTYFCSPGKNDNGNQDMLHSVYFAVPNEFISKYGEMTAVHATWLNAVLKPALVTGNEDAYNALLNYLGKNVGTYDKNLRYSYIADFYEDHFSGSYYYMKGSFGYNYEAHKLNKYGYLMTSPINVLYLLFGTEDFSEDSADTYTVSSEDLIAAMKDTYPNFGGTSYFAFDSHVSSNIFESIDEDYTEQNWTVDKIFSLENQVITQNWWQKIWGTNTVVPGSFEGIKAIQRVESSMFASSIEDTCNSLFICESDYEEFLNYFENSKASDSTVYLFRYQTSEYISREATLIDHDKIVWPGTVDTNAYFFQQTVYLNFDIIDVTFSNGEKETVVPVVSLSQDIVPDITPPLDTTPDNKLDIEFPDFSGLFDDLKNGFNDFTDILSLILGGIGIAAIVFIVIVIIRFAGIVFAPIVWLFKAIFKKKE